jgi:peptidoglycan hydrolase-like protein with peptidoglycan-binding domain
VSIINDRSMPMNKLVFATVIALPLAASFPALAQQGSAAPQPAPPGASQGVAAITLSEDQVRQLQQALNDNGFDAGEVDGVFGARTKAALSRFQSKAGLQPTGQMDQQTLALVGLSGQAQQPATAPAAPDQSTGQGNPGDQQGSPGPRQ